MSNLAKFFGRDALLPKLLSGELRLPVRCLLARCAQASTQTGLPSQMLPPSRSFGGTSRQAGVSAAKLAEAGA